MSFALEWIGRLASLKSVEHSSDESQGCINRPLIGGSRPSSRRRTCRGVWLDQIARLAPPAASLAPCVHLMARASSLTILARPAASRAAKISLRMAATGTTLASKGAAEDAAKAGHYSFTGFIEKLVLDPSQHAVQRHRR
jgi:hypothetical protein